MLFSCRRILLHKRINFLGSLESVIICWPLFNQMTIIQSTCETYEWNSQKREVKFFLLTILAIHNWKGNVNHGLALDVGDFVDIYEENGPWLRGTCTRKPRSIGIFPKSYVHVKDPSKEDPIVAECTQGNKKLFWIKFFELTHILIVLREWSEIWKKLFVVRKKFKFKILK